MGAWSTKARLETVSAPMPARRSTAWNAVLSRPARWPRKAWPTASGSFSSKDDSWRRERRSAAFHVPVLAPAQVRHHSSISVLTESTVRPRVCGHEPLARLLAVRPALGRDGRSLGPEPNRRADPRAALPDRPADARRRAVRNARRRPLQRQHEPARAAELGPGAAGSSQRRPARSLRDLDARLGADADHRSRAPAARD